ncbi:sensor histidine kinase [Roseobacter litoralis]|uniref:histidine kinase n=1 Tax=Roseobacter litoralis (strain ATCC 49566 / DSM 6996 / JCM 21268 / NBRC 15278 / OCh 149) TaxID=391595 RepID=F7ZF61_ROSLO|nr:sensor histidine kinase [Roseobacter litoralis]AEI93492.1 sensor transduction histidine kinase [Roseobacter litoralis Och 149]
MSEVVRSSASLRRRLTVGLIGGAAVLAVLIYLFTRAYATQIAQQGQDNILNASVSSILDSAVIRNGNLEIDFPYAALAMLNTELDDRVFYAIYRDDALLSGYALLPRRAPDGVEAISWTDEFNGAAVRITSDARRLFATDRQTVISVSMAQTQDALSETLRDISNTVALFGVSFFALAAALSFWASSATIRPLNRLTSSITRRGPQDLSPVEKPVPKEMVPLVSSLNNLMSRLDQSLQRSEDFIAEAAHRVRTPLATVRSHAEATLQRVEKEENRKALRSMVRAIDESSRAAGQLLDHAMITFRADHLERQSLDLTELVIELVSRLEPVAEMKDIAFHLETDPQVIVLADPILVQNAIRNLIDNALKYAPAESEITIRVDQEAAGRVTICDQGPGFPSDEMASLVDRFARGRNATGITGSGLGLTIAQDVAQAHGGALTLSNRKEGGACVILSF